MTLDELRPRICIMGPSNSGKSTLADAISQARRLTAIHLDQLHHLPHTNWVPRPADEFAALHDSAILRSCWVIDGNYSRLLPRRLERATGVILLDVPTAVSLYRYLKRCWFNHDRRGALEGGRDTVKWAMIRHITIATRANRARYARMFEDIHLPKVRSSRPAHLPPSTARTICCAERRSGPRILRGPDQPWSAVQRPAERLGQEYQPD